jgi:uncharacterized protein (PEP-CTERM system associated)
MTDISKRPNARFRKRLLVLSLLISPYLSAGQLFLDAGVDLERVEQDILVENENRDVDSSSNIIKPYLALIYEGPKFEALFQGTHNHIQRELDGVDATQNFTSFNYTTSYDLIDNFLNFQLNGSQSYRSDGINTFLEQDFLLFGDELNKINSNSAILSLTLDRGQYFGLTGSATYSKQKSDPSSANSTRFSGLYDSENYGLNFNLQSGTKLEDTRLTLYGNLNNSKRQASQDYESQTFGFESDSKVISDFGVVFNGYYENNEITTDLDTERDGLREFYSFGAGLSWQPAMDRTLKVTWNRSFTESRIDPDEDDENSYLSYDINWAFSERTALQANLSKRFYGDSKMFSLTHQLRNWRSSVQYNETVTNSSQLINNAIPGLLICDGATGSIGNCSLSQNLNATLEPGQISQSLLIPNFELNDRVVLSKGWVVQSAITRKRTTLSLTASRTENEDLEIDSIYETDSLNATILVKLSRKTELELQQQYAKIDQTRDSIFAEETTKEQSIKLTHRLTRRFDAAVELSKLDREGELDRQNQSLVGLNGPLTDNRITFTISYNFGDRR